ncbi:MAG TPA: c-type cytochrome [Terriglobales bacterium]|nr:c-type cytochrome [Terriglobales bacterium]
MTATPGRRQLSRDRLDFGYVSMLTRSPLRIVILLLCAYQFRSRTALCQETTAGSLPNGEAIFLQRCARCHGEKGEGVNTVITIAGPSIQAEHDPGLAMTAMEAGPSHMPSFAFVLSVAEMRAVADYVTQKLAIIPLAGGNVSDGGKLYRVNCAPCHRTAGRGGALAFTGINAPDISEKSPALVAGAIRWGPGPMPAFPSSVLDDKQLDSIVEYVKLIQRPPTPGGSPLNFYGPVAEGFAAWTGIFLLMIIVGWIERGGRG